MTAIVLAVSLLLAAPAILGVVRGTGEVDTALLHLVLALVITSVAAQVVRSIVRDYQAQAERAVPEPAEVDEPLGRRRGDR